MVVGTDTGSSRRKMTVGGNGGCVVENWHGMVGVGATKAKLLETGSHLCHSYPIPHYSITSHGHITESFSHYGLLFSLFKVFEAASAGKSLIFLKKGF